MKRNKLIYMIVFSLVFLGFTSGVNAANVNCCYKTNDGVYTYASMPEGVCNTYTDHSTNLTQSECANKNVGCCYNANNKWQYTTESLKCSQNHGQNGITKEACENKNSNTNCCYKSNDGLYYFTRDAVTCSQNHGENGYTESSCKGKNSGNNNTGTTEGPINTRWETRTDCSHTISQSDCEKTQSDGSVGTYDYQTGCCTFKKLVNTPATDQSDPDNNSAGNGSTNASSGSTGGETIVIGFDCNDPSVNSIIATVKTIYNLLRYATPVILILMGSVDFLKATVAGKDDEIEKNKKKFMNRLFIAVIIFLILSIFQLTTNVLEKAGVTNSNSWVECWNHVNEN